MNDIHMAMIKIKAAIRAAAKKEFPSYTLIYARYCPAINKIKAAAYRYLNTTSKFSLIASVTPYVALFSALIIFLKHNRIS